MEALGLIAQKVSGQAQAGTGDLSVQMAILKAKTDEFQEAVGNQLIPILTQLVQKVDPIIQKVLDWTEAHPKLTKAIVLTVGALGLILTAIGALGLLIAAMIPAITAIGIVIGVLTSPIGLVILAIAALIAIGVLLITHWNLVKSELGKLGDWFKQIWDEITGYVQSAANKIMSFIQPLLNAINSVVNGVKNLPGGSAILNGIGSAASSAASLLTGIPHFAAGGIVSSPTLALVGESGPEAIIPLSAGGMSAGGAGTVINVMVTGNTISNQLNLRNMADIISREIVNKLRINSKISV